jgi:hypothetical protein
MSAYYYHKQVMEDRGIQTKDLPDNLRKYISTFQRKVNFLKDPEKIRELQEFSQLLGEKIAETEIKRKSTISDLTNELQNETIVPQTEPVSYEKGGEIDAELGLDESEKEDLIKEDIEEPIIKDEIVEELVNEDVDNEEKVELEKIEKVEPKTEVIGKFSDDEKEEEKEDSGLLSFLKW